MARPGTSIHHIAGADPLLAEKSTEIDRDFEMLTMSTLPNGSPEVSDDDGAVPCLRCGRWRTRTDVTWRSMSIVRWYLETTESQGT